MYWSEQILEEARRNLVESRTTTEERAQHLMATMRRAFPEATVRGYEALIAAMPNQEKDRHVTAAAVKAGAQVIVTQNLRDFAHLPDGLEARSPDDFLEGLFELDPDGVLELLEAQAAALQRPARTLEEILAALEKMVPEFASAVRRHMAAPGEQ